MAEQLAAPAAQAVADQEPSDEEIRSVLDGLDVCPQRNLIGVLQEAQERLGYLPAAALDEIARRMRIPLSRVYGVVSFYSQFYTEPRGRHMVRACRGTACHVRGGKSVIRAVQDSLGIDDGQTTEDMMFSFETVACLGACALSPVFVVDGVYYGKATAKRVEEVLTQTLADASETEEAD